MKSNTKLKIRVAGVIHHKKSILLHRNEKNAYWSLPGGKVELDESSGEALLRELKEEANLNGALGPLLWVIENFYERDERRYHEIGFYYSVSLMGPQTDSISFKGKEGKSELHFQWFNLDEIANLNISPAILKSLLTREPGQTPAHIVVRNT